MNCSLRLAITLFGAGMVLGAVGLRAQHEHESVAPEKLGKVHFPISCSAAAQQQFERGVAILHSFGYEDAAETFTRVTETDPQCAMAYWGVAMSQNRPLWEPPDEASLKRGLAAVEKGEAIVTKSDRERDYLAAVKAFYQDWNKADHHTRSLVYEKAMERVYLRYPEDQEAAAFYALSLLATAPPSDKSYANQKKAGAILEKIFAEQPDHPGVAHYLIHAYDYPPLASRAVPAARRYAQIAPAAPHALHMPSHIFTRLGLWEDSIVSNLAAEAASKDYAVRNHINGAWHQQLHAMDYLEYAYLQGAEDRKAGLVLEELNAIQTVVPENLNSTYALAAIPARYTLERGDWTSAATLTSRETSYPQTDAITFFARAIGAARSGEIPIGEKNLQKLSSLRDALVLQKSNYWADQVEIQWRAAAAWLEHAHGHNEEGLRLMRSAADLESRTEKDPVTPGAVLPARELLGDMLVELKQPGAAVSEYELSLQAAPNRFRALYGAAQSAKLSGDSAKAKTYFQQLLAVANRAEGDRAELRQAREFLQKP